MTALGCSLLTLFPLTGTIAAIIVRLVVLQKDVKARCWFYFVLPRCLFGNTSYGEFFLSF